MDMGFPGSPQIQNFAGVTLLSGKSYVAIRASSCFICNGIVVWLWGSGQDEAVQEFRAWPLGSERPVSVEVPDNIASIFKRASRQLGIDSVASAAFSRTCLEKLLDDQSIPRIGDNNRSLNLQNRIQAFMKSKQLSQELSAKVDILREMGNFIHLNESLLTGDVVEISEGEALWALDILDDLFNELYATPAIQKQRREEFENKLRETGKRKPPDPVGGT